jgi:hypothetical protein
MNSQRRYTDDDGPMRPVEKKKQKRAKPKKFNVRDYFHELWRTVKHTFEDNFAEFVLDDWQWEQHRRMRRHVLVRLEEQLTQGLHDTLYARRILRKGKR